MRRVLLAMLLLGSPILHSLAIAHPGHGAVGTGHDPTHYLLDPWHQSTLAFALLAVLVACAVVLLKHRQTAEIR